MYLLCRLISDAKKGVWSFLLETDVDSDMYVCSAFFVSV